MLLLTNPTRSRKPAPWGIINVSNKDNPYGFHPGGVVAVRGDGSVMFLNEDVSPEAFVALVGRDDGKAFHLDTSNRRFASGRRPGWLRPREVSP